MENRTVWSTDPTYYTVMYKKKGSRRYYRCGYRMNSIGEARDLARADMKTGRYTAAKVVRWDTEEMIEKI